MAIVGHSAAARQLSDARNLSSGRPLLPACCWEHVSPECCVEEVRSSPQAWQHAILRLSCQAAAGLRAAVMMSFDRAPLQAKSLLRKLQHELSNMQGVRSQTRLCVWMGTIVETKRTCGMNGKLKQWKSSFDEHVRIKQSLSRG